MTSGDPVAFTARGALPSIFNSDQSRQVFGHVDRQAPARVHQEENTRVATHLLDRQDLRHAIHELGVVLRDHDNIVRRSVMAPSAALITDALELLTLALHLLLVPGVGGAFDEAGRPAGSPGCQ
eukprot:9127037-Heterocapsa_arctica.AAC.1